MKKYFYYLSLLFFVSGNSMSDFSRSEIEINKVIGIFKKEMKKKGIFLVGTGGSEKEGKCSLIHLQFQIDDELNLENGRLLAIEITNNFLKLLNSKKNIEHYLTKYPFTNHETIVSFFGKKYSANESVFDIVSADQGEIRYSVIIAGKPLKLIHKENFQEAQAITNMSNRNYFTN